MLKIEFDWKSRRVYTVTLKNYELDQKWKLQAIWNVNLKRYKNGWKNEDYEQFNCKLLYIVGSRGASQLGGLF